MANAALGDYEAAHDFLNQMLHDREQNCVRTALALVSSEINDEQGSAGREHARGLCNRGGRGMGVMKDLVNHDRVRALVNERQRIHIALPKARLAP